MLLRLFPLTEQKQTLFSIVVFSSSCWEGVSGISVGILLLWNIVGKDAWAKYLYKHGQQRGDILTSSFGSGKNVSSAFFSSLFYAYIFLFNPFSEVIFFLYQNI